MAGNKAGATLRRAPKGRVPARPPALARQAWWAWLTCGDEALTERLAGYCDGLPPWLDRAPWLFIGLAMGELLGWPLRLVARPTGNAGVVWLAVTAGAIPAYLGLALSGRERVGEEAGDFAARVAATLLHLPYLVLMAGACVVAAAATEGLLQLGDQAILVPAVGAGLGLLVLVAARTATPRMLTAVDYDDTWPTLAGLGSFVFRLATALVASVVLAASAESRWLKALALVPALALSLGLRWQERLAKGLALWLGRTPVRSRRWPPRCLPAPFALESELVAQEDDPEARRLAADYCDARDYPPQELDAAARSMWRAGRMTPRRARAAALCGLELWTDDDAAPDAAYRGLARLEVLAERYPQALDAAFWAELAERVDGGRRAVAAALLLRHREQGPFRPAELWPWLRRLQWTAGLTALPPDERLDLVDAVLALQHDLGRPELCSEALRDLDDWRLAEPQAAAVLPPAEWRRRLAEAAAACLGASAGSGPLPNNHPGYALALRLLAYRASEGQNETVRSWYAAAHRFEALPAVRRDELLGPAAYFELWREVLSAAPDPEELARQEERCRKALGGRAGNR